MSFEIQKTNLDGLMIIHPHLYHDHRGEYRKNFEKHKFAEWSIACEFTESSDLCSKKGALRGLHYQSWDAQAKLIHVIRGKLYDIAVDLRKDSSTFGQYFSILLDGDVPKCVFIPEGFAHGFLSLTDDTIFSYQCSGKYVPEACGGIQWDDPHLKIPWPLEEYQIEKVIVTEKDAKWPSMEEFIKNIGGL